MVAKIRVDYDDKGATENLEDLAEGAGYTGSEFDKLSDRVDEAEKATHKMGRTADQATALFGKMASAAAAAFSATKIIEAVNRTNRMSDALAGAQLNTGLTTMETEKLARQLQIASSNALGYADALEFISRGTQTAALTTKDMADAIEFAAINAKSTGQDVRQSIDQVTEALVNSSAETLKKIGLLPGGIDQVRFAYDELKGVGAFDQLTEEARRFETQLIALEIMQDRIKDLDEMGLTGMNSMDELAGATNRVNVAFSRLVDAGGGGDWFGDLARTIDRVVVPVLDTFSAAVEGIRNRTNLMAESILRWQSDLVGFFEMIGLASEGASDDIAQLADKFHEAREGEKLLEEQRRNSQDAAAAAIKERRDAEAAERKRQAEAWAAEKQAAEDARLAAQEAANAEREREKQLRDLIRLREQKQRESEHEEREAERDRERALQERMRLEQQQYRERLKQLDEEIQKEKELQQLQQQKIDDIKSLIRAQGGDGASAIGGPGGGPTGEPSRPQGMQFAGPLGGFFAGLVGEQQARFNFAASRIPGGAQGGGGPPPPPGAGGGPGGGLPSRMSGGNATQQIIDNVFAGVDQNKIEDEVIRIRVEAAMAERDAVIAKARAGEGGTISQRRDTVRQAEAQFAEQRRQAFRSGRRGAFDEKERDEAVQNIVQNEIERAGKSAELDQNTVKAMAELAKEQAAQIAQMDRIEKAQQAIMQTIMTNRRTRAQRAGRGR